LLQMLSFSAVDVYSDAAVRWRMSLMIDG